MLRLLFVLILALSAVPSFAQNDIPDLYSMVVDNKGIQLTNNRHIVSLPDSKVAGAWISPNAKYLAFTAQSYSETNDEAQSLFCTRVNETKSYTLQASASLPKNTAPGTEAWHLSKGADHITPAISWSPDSSLVAFATEKFVYTGTDGASCIGLFIKVVTPTGMQRASFDIGGLGSISGKIIWSPDCRSFASLFVDETTVDRSVKPGDKPDYKIVVFTLSSGHIETVYTQEGGPLILEGWSSDGKSVTYATAQDIAARSKTAKHPFWSMEADYLQYLIRDRSPDGKWWSAPSPQGIKLTSDADGSTIDTIKEPAQLVCWAPNNRMYAYIKPVPIEDDSKLRGKVLCTLWLGTIAKHKLNCMCVSFDSDLSAQPTWSADSTSMAYICGGSAYLAQFISRDLTLREKVNGGITLTDEEYKAIVMQNAKEIGVAFQIYQADWDDQVPPKDQIDEKLHSYLRHSDALLKPGTNDSILQYECDLPRNKIDDPATTVRAYLDAAPGWRVAIYADGHTEIVPNQ